MKNLVVGCIIAGAVSLGFAMIDAVKQEADSLKDLTWFGWLFSFLFVVCFICSIAFNFWRGK